MTEQRQAVDLVHAEADAHDQGAIAFPPPATPPCLSGNTKVLTQMGLKAVGSKVLAQKGQKSTGSRFRAK